MSGLVPAEQALIDRFIGLFPPISLSILDGVVAYAPDHASRRQVPQEERESLAVIDALTGKEHAPTAMGRSRSDAVRLLGRRPGAGLRLGTVAWCGSGTWTRRATSDRCRAMPRRRRGRWPSRPTARPSPVAGDDGAIRLWDARSGQAGRVLTGHPSLVTSIAYSPDGRLLASGGYDKTVRLWDPETGDGLAILAGHQDRVLRRGVLPGRPHARLGG